MAKLGKRLAGQGAAAYPKVTQSICPVPIPACVAHRRAQENYQGRFVCVIKPVGLDFGFSFAV